MISKKIFLNAVLFISFFVGGCMSSKDFNYNVEKFSDIEVLRYQVPQWDKLTLKEKELAYYLVQAGLSGRDITWDQNYRYNIAIRNALEHIYTNYKGDKTTKDWHFFETYLKRIWFSNGIHHHYAKDKIQAEFSKEYFQQLLSDTKTILDSKIVDVIFNDVDIKMVNLDPSKDLVKGSAVNFYDERLTFKEVDDFYSKKIHKDEKRPLSFGLNSKLIKNEQGKLEEKVWKKGGMYGDAIERIIFWLKKAVDVAENIEQAEALKILIKYYETGDLALWDEYNIAWLKADKGNIDYINGFIEVYNDPLGHKGAYENIVQIKDLDMSEKMSVISDHAQWFEDHSPIDEQYKKKNVVGIQYNTVIAVGEAGDSSPSTPIGVNLPNADWIREEYGSKSISLGNIIDAYDLASGDQIIKEFALTPEEVKIHEQYNFLAGKLHTALHEVIGHASGQLAPGVRSPKDTLKNYASALEEGRADLVALYFLYDPKIQSLGLTDDWEKTAKSEYNGYIRGGLMTQLFRINLGSNIEESHMRNRQFISKWVYEKGLKDNVIEKIVKNNKTYFRINDYSKLKELFGVLLKEIQRIKSEGDFEAGKALVENYGVKVDQGLHKEVLKRFEQFDVKPYKGFINPVIEPKLNQNGQPIDFVIRYVNSFAEQMLYYSSQFGLLPEKN